MTATDEFDAELFDTDPSHYFGVVGAIDIEKATNGEDADAPPGPQVSVGAPVTWTYLVTNPGNVPVAVTAVTDDHPGVVPAFRGGDADGDGLVDPSETWTYEASGTAQAGQYANIGTVMASLALPARSARTQSPFRAIGLFDAPAPTALPTVLTDTDPSHYFGSSPLVPPEADLVLTKKTIEPDVVQVGQKLRFKITVRNNGPDQADDVVVEDDLPNDVKVLSVEPSQGSCVKKPSIRCELGDLPAGAKATIRIEVRTLKPGKVVNAAVVSSNTPDPDPDNNRDRDDGKARKAEISINKSVDQKVVEPGDEVTYTIVVRSHSNRRLTDIRVCDRLPDGVFLSHAPGAHQNADGDLCWTINLPPHGKHKFKVVVEVGSISGHKKLRNVAVAGGPSVRSVQDAARSEGRAPKPGPPPGACPRVGPPGASTRC